MNICEDASYKHLEDLIQRNLSSEEKVIDEMNLSVDRNKLEHSLVPFIHKIYNKNAIMSFNSVTSPNFCDIDYDNSENEVTEIAEDSCVKWNSIANSEDFSKATLVNDNSCHNRSKGSLNNNKLHLHKNFSKWNNHKPFSTSKSQKTISAFKRPHHLSTESELLPFSGKSKSDNSIFQYVQKGHVLKENNCSDISQMPRIIKQQSGCDNKKSSLSSVKDDKKHFDVRTQDSSRVHAEVENISQEEIHESDDSDSDEELLKVPVALIQSDQNKSSGKEQKCVKNCLVSCLSLDKIIEIRKSEMEKDMVIKNQELMPANNFENHRDTELLQLLKNADDLDRSKPEEDRILDLPPGIAIFNLQICCYFCPLHSLSLKSCGFIGDKGTLIEKKLAKMSLTEIQDMVALGVIKTHLNSALFKEALLKYLFRILSAHDNERLAYACQDTFFGYINSSAIYWYPSVTEVIVTILNYGISTTNRCPIKDVLLSVEKMLEPSECSSCFGKENHEFSLVINGLSRIIETFTLFLEQKCLKTYYQEEICDFILLLCWLNLDVRLLGKPIEVKIGRCIAAGLEIISASDWPDKMKYLAEKLAELGGHHRNTLYIAAALPVSERGFHLRKAVCFLAVQYLLNAECPCFFADVTPFMLLDLLKIKPLHHVKDYFLLHTIVSLTDLCVGNKVLPLYREAINGMCTLALNTCCEIGKKNHYPEGSQVIKALLLRMYVKWSFLIPNMPHRMKMFASSDDTECDASIESHYVPEVKEEIG